MMARASCRLPVGCTAAVPASALPKPMSLEVGEHVEKRNPAVLALLHQANQLKCIVLEASSDLTSSGGVSAVASASKL